MKLHLPLFLRAAVLACVAASPCSAAATESGSTMHLYILTGQSNSLGAVKGSPATPEQLEQYASDGKLWNGNMTYLDNSGTVDSEAGTLYEPNPAWVTVAPQAPTYENNNCMGPEYGFSHMMLRKGWIDTASGDGLGVIKASLDGGGNGCWVKGTPTYDSLLSSVKNAIDAMQTSGSYTKISLEGLMYLQGESNTTEEAAIAKDRYKQFLSDLKADLAAGGYDSSLLVGGVLEQSVLGEPATWKETDKTNTVTQLEALADEDNTIGWVRTRDLTKITSGDAFGVHYDGKSQITIGARYAYAMALQQGKDVGAVRNDATGVSLNDEAAWWNGAAPTANDVVVWDVSSANVADTLSGDLSVRGIRVEDPFRSRISISAASGTTPTLSLGSGGIELQNAGLDIGVNLTTTAEQTWQVAGGQSLTIGSSIGGNHTVTLGKHSDAALSSGVAQFNFSAVTDAGARTWNLGDGVQVALSDNGFANSSLAVETSATATLTGGAVALNSLTLGNNTTLNLADGLTLSAGTVNISDAAALTFNYSNGNFSALNAGTITAGENSAVTINLGQASNLSGSKFTLGTGWSGWSVASEAGSGKVLTLLGSSAPYGYHLSVDSGGNLILSNAPMYLVDWPSRDEGTPTQTITEDGAYNATSTATNTLTNAKTATGKVYFFANNTNNSTGDFYGELQDVSVTWVSAFGSERGNSKKTMTGTSHAKVSGSEPITVTSVYGAVNATVNAQDGVDNSGSVYVELANPNATYSGNYQGAYNSTVKGDVTLVVKGGTYKGYILGGGASTSTSTSTIEGSTHVYITAGDIRHNVYAGNLLADDTIKKDAELRIDGGNFSNAIWVAAGGTGGTIEGTARLIINGGTFGNLIVAAGGTGGTINGGTELIITGGDFSGLTGGTGDHNIYAGGKNTTITGGTKTILSGIDNDNAFYSYAHILSGGNESGGSIEGEKLLELQGYTADQVNAQLQAFDTINVTQDSKTKITSSNNSTLGGATALNVDGKSTLELAAESNAWDLSGTDATVGAGSVLKKSGTGQLTLKSLSGDGAFEATEGTTVLNSQAANSYTGTTTVKGGELVLSGEGSLGTGTVTLEQAATGLKMGDTTLSAKGNDNGTISGHTKVSAKGIEGSVTQLANLTNISIEALSTQDTAFIRYARLENVSMLFGLQTGMTLSNVTFDARSSACLAEGEGTRSGSVRASNTTIELSSTEFATPALLAAAAADDPSGLTSTKVIEKTLTRFNALTFTDTLILNDQEGAIAGLFNDNPGVEEVVVNFDGANLTDVTRINYMGTLPSGIQANRVQNAVVFSAEENVPEPTTTTLSLLALAAIAARRRRKDS